MTSPSIRHAPLGAHASFDFGPPGAPAGFAVPAARPPAQPVYVGCRQSDAGTWSLLPSFSPVADGPRPLPNGRYGRFLALAGDKWMIGPLVFKISTPFPDAVGKGDFLRAPVVCGYLEYDNSHSDEAAELIFGVGGNAQSVREKGLVGYHFDHSHGFVTASSPEVEALRDRELFAVEIGSAVALRFRVPPRSKRIYPLVFGFFVPTSRYAEDLPDLVSVFLYGLAQHPRFLAAADALDAAFMQSSLAFEEKGRLAREVRALLAETSLESLNAAAELNPLLEILRRIKPWSEQAAKP